MVVKISNIEKILLHSNRAGRKSLDSGGGRHWTGI